MSTKADKDGPENKQQEKKDDMMQHKKEPRISPVPAPKLASPLPQARSGASFLLKGGSIAANNARLANTTACLPIAYGSVAFHLAKKADDYSTHEWTLYVRGPNNEDLGPAISKVIFQLHPSFAQPTRELTSPPFQVTERGWGEFEAQIKIMWKDPSEKPIILMHVIKLYPPGNSNMQPTKEPVVSEFYDEVVFTDPKESFFHQLRSISKLPPITGSMNEGNNSSTPAGASTELHDCFLEYTDEEEMQRLLEAKKFLEAELFKVKDRLHIIAKEMAEVDQGLLEVQTKKPPSASILQPSSTTTTTGKASASKEPQSKRIKATK